MTAQELKEILGLHAKWQAGDPTGVRANLYNADLSRAVLREANLYNADLRRAVLCEANLYGANLYGAVLRGANLYRAVLREANLYRADLREANLREADLSRATLPAFQIPQEGDLIVWKKLQGNVLAKLLVPAAACRTASLVGRKCRAEYVKVLELIGTEERCAPSCHKSSVMYVVGETVHPDSYDDDIRVEYTHGIHFFLTKEEAEEWR